jgi:hypothetical protein
MVRNCKSCAVTLSCGSVFGRVFSIWKVRIGTGGESLNFHCRDRFARFPKPA